MSEDIKGWRESRFWRALLCIGTFGSVIWWSNELFGKADEQPWWGVAATIIIAVALSAYVWRQVRTFERQSA